MEWKMEPEGAEVLGFTSFAPKRGVAHCLARFDVFEADIPFERFVDAVAGIPDEEADSHFRSQHTFITDKLGDIGVNFVGRFESLARDRSAVCERLGLSSLALLRVQAVGAPKRYVEYYSPRTVGIVASRYREDVELFGYELESV